MVTQKSFQCSDVMSVVARVYYSVLCPFNFLILKRNKSHKLSTNMPNRLSIKSITLLLFSISIILTDNMVTSSEADEAGRDLPWFKEILKEIQKTLIACRRKTDAFNTNDEDYQISLIRMKNCVKEVILTTIDHAFSEQVIPFNMYLSMVKERNITENDVGRSKEDAISEDLYSSIYKRVYSLLETHSFKVDLHPLTVKQDQVEGRRRHHYRRAFPMMVAGFMMMSAFLVPLGFQFMAMIGGKALLLAKIAFLMSIMSGYRRITNELDYHHHHSPTSNALLHHLAFHHRSSDAPMTAAYTNHPHHGLVPLLKKG